MMTLHTILEDFGSTGLQPHRPLLSEEVLENERLDFFDKGYRAGWDDAIKAKADENANMSNELAQKLQDLSFTYHEVHTQVMSNLSPLFEEILEKILPTIAQDSLGAHIAEQLTALARDIGTATVQITVAPDSVGQVQQFVDEVDAELPMDVDGDPNLAAGQAEIRFGRREIVVDLAAVAAQISEAVHAVLYDNPERQAHG